LLAKQSARDALLSHPTYSSCHQTHKLTFILSFPQYMIILLRLWRKPQSWLPSSNDYVFLQLNLLFILNSTQF